MPQVSVITTIYNGAAFIDRAVSSVLNQTFANFEYIIVNDGSTDNTLELLNELATKDPRIQVISLSRVGRIDALNTAVRRARGEYIANIDIDDLAFCNRLEAQIKALEQDPNIGVIGGAYRIKNDIRNEVFDRTPPTSHEALLKLMVKQIPFAHSVATFRKRAWEQAGGYKPLANEDLMLWYEMIRKGWKVASVPEIIGEHWKHKDSYWQRNFRYIKRQLTLAQLQIQIARGLNMPILYSIYPLGRLIYAWSPNAIKKLVRNFISPSKESYFN